MKFYLEKIFIFLLFICCSKKESVNYICPDGDCWVSLYTDFNEDSNQYHHVTPDWFSETSGRFNLHIESSPSVQMLLRAQRERMRGRRMRSMEAHQVLPQRPIREI